MDRPYSPETLADRWGCSAEKVRTMYRNGELDGFRLGKLNGRDAPRSPHPRATPMTRAGEGGIRIVNWFGAGAASAVATRLTLRDFPNAIVAYCETNAEHPDNERFAADCTRWFNAPLTRLASTEYLDTWDVWESRSYISGIEGAPCTGALKRRPREQFQRPGDIHVFGYTADKTDVERAQRLKARWPDLIVSTPLIDRGLDKAACLAIVEGAGIKLPVMYGLGFSNNNCIPCPKATSPNYWSAIRLHFPDQFERMAKLSRDLGARLARIHDERIFIDEIPTDWPTLNPVSPSCDFLCHIAEQDLAT